MTLKFVFKKEIIKDVGKSCFDISKLIIAVAIITPLVKNDNISITPFIVALISAMIGVHLFNKGAEKWMKY